MRKSTSKSIHESIHGGGLSQSTIRADLLELFPHARPSVVTTLLKCLELHNAKNNDYNGGMELYRLTGVYGRFCEVWRKVIRLFNAIVNKHEMVVTESLVDTIRDAINYLALLEEELTSAKEKNK
jgi:hypothetical protein